MHFIIIKSRLFNRWRVYSMGHLEGDRTWLATFRNAADAAAWANAIPPAHLQGEAP